MSKCCALAFQQTEVTVASMSTSLLLSSAALGEEFERYVNHNALRGKKTIGILNQADYQLLRIKKPTVRTKEMLTAILWQEQAQFSLPIDQLVVDYVECPTVVGDKKIYVVATAKRLLKERHQALLNVHLQPIKITVPELVYAQYVQKYYAQEMMVVWVNYFADCAQALAFYRGELFASLRLPKMDTNFISEACVTALNLFYFSEIKPFSVEPLWIFNGLFEVEPTMLEPLNGRKRYLKNDDNADFYKILATYNHSSASHVYYGMMANE